MRSSSWRDQGQEVRSRGREDLGDPERPLHPVVLGDRDVLTDNEPVTIEPEDRLLFLVAHAVVVERPVVATVMD
jgi:hypothetical protein